MKRKRNKTVSICRWHDCLCKKSYKILLEWISEFSKVQDAKQTCKPFTFLYTSNEDMNTEIKNTIPFIISKMLMCKSNKTFVGFVCWKLYNTDERNHHKWSDIPCPWIEKFNIDKVSVFTNWYTGLMQFLLKSQQNFFRYSIHEKINELE